MVLHDPALALRYADRLLLMQDRQVLTFYKLQLMHHLLFLLYLYQEFFSKIRSV